MTYSIVVFSKMVGVYLKHPANHNWLYCQQVVEREKTDTLEKYCYSFYKKRHSLCLERLISRVSHPVSLYNISKDTSLVAPVTIRAASD